MRRSANQESPACNSRCSRRRPSGLNGRNISCRSTSPDGRSCWRLISVRLFCS
ncbi:uncharacterized protein HMPREF1541_08992 [Cyphellophora europaea CBS 101466]|uniref:Uncharacterized protein n=1 Tax=Cyphellophora europaea (strain CBS 101466) TaxID=1220924 RepID=W2RLV3_CYPE1|nr:uncharacterized protein HMPREF1541_08992 [Cyphellophora europaea CBS 101466]ETN36714.1 hypothetical protein HMPREF1541_08992 [Cyphellophora europaea CBS 101466]